jgi:recombination protein RecA
MFGEGISWEGELIDLGVEHNLVEKSGAWYSYKGERIGQGRENAKQFLRDNPDVFKRVDAELRKALKLVKVEGEAAANGAPQAPAAAPAQAPTRTAPPPPAAAARGRG